MNFNVIKSVLYLHLCTCPTDAKLLFKAKVLVMLTVTEKRNKTWTPAEEASLFYGGSLPFLVIDAGQLCRQTALGRAPSSLPHCRGCPDSD